MGKKLAGIEYIGEDGFSKACQDAVVSMIQCGREITLAQIVSCSQEHALVLTDSHKSLIAVKSGFTSGYAGEGPRRFSYTLQLLDSHGVHIQEYSVESSFMKRLANSALTEADIRGLKKMKSTSKGNWHDYVFIKHINESWGGDLWKEFPPIIPFRIIDGRIMDLAISFWKAPDQKLLTAYRRLEDIVREKVGAKDHGAKLFSKLTWKDLDTGEREGRFFLFRGIYMTYRNPRAHREIRDSADQHLAEFLLLNHLYLLEKESFQRTED